jgi:hypothetical protein
MPAKPVSLFLFNGGNAYPLTDVFIFVQNLTAVSGIIPKMHTLPCFHWIMAGWPETGDIMFKVD